MYLNLADDDSGVFRTNALDRGGQYEGDSHVRIRPPSDPTNVFTGESWWIGHQRGDGSGNTYGYIKGDRISDDIDYKDINNYNNLRLYLYLGNGGSPTELDVNIERNDTSIVISGLSEDVTGYDGDVRDFFH